MNTVQRREYRPPLAPPTIMGSRERLDREREAVRIAILEAARALFVTEGYRNVSMRKVAERIEYSPAAIYGYFPGKSDIFFALFEEGFRLLAEAYAASAPATLDPELAVRQMFLEYYRFSRTHPQFFELMFLDRSVPQISEQWERFGFVNDKMAEGIAVVQQAVDAGVFPAGTDASAAFHILWASVHGPATIGVCTRLAPDEDPDALARDVLDAAMAGLRAGSCITFKPGLNHRPALADRTTEGRRE